MILIADSGSTKTEWRLLGRSNSHLKTCITKGINPFYQTSSEILKSLNEEYKLNNIKLQEVHFYGAGCANKEKNKIVKAALTRFFTTENITVNSDLTGAARSLCQNDKGVACILGTGSNSCYYNGHEVIANVSPLGFIIGDEGSGAALGKKLIGDIFKNQLSDEVTEIFFKEYRTDRTEVLDNIYKRPLPNRYLAQYTKFISANIHIKELEKLVITSFNEFICRNLLQYENVFKVKINFTGSIAYHFRPQLKKALTQFDLTLGIITQAPMDGLVQYHHQLKNCNGKK